MKKIRNDKSSYLSRSALAQSPASEKKRPDKVVSRGDFKVDAAGYFIWPKKQKAASSSS